MSKVPQCPTQITQGGGASVRTVLASVVSMILCIVQCSRLLEMMQAVGKLPHHDVGGADYAMSNASRCSVVAGFRLSKELQSDIALFGDVASDVVADPYAEQDGKFL